MIKSNDEKFIFKTKKADAILDDCNFKLRGVKTAAYEEADTMRLQILNLMENPLQCNKMREQQRKVIPNHAASKICNLIIELTRSA